MSRPSEDEISIPDAPGEHAESDPEVVALVQALRLGDASRLQEVLEERPSLATVVVDGRSPLHVFADAPGHRPNAAAVVGLLVGAGADLDTPVRGAFHHETPLHWAASNDDVELIDVLIDAGADIEHPGSSIGGGPPSQSALGYAQWGALRRLYERGATVNLPQAAALGLMALVASTVEAPEAPSSEEISVAFWNACRAGQLDVAKYLHGQGANLNWAAPWSGQTPLDAATSAGRGEVARWLADQGATGGS